MSAKKSGPKNPAPAVATLSLADLTPDPANVRRHTDRNKAAVGSSVRRFGAARSIVLDRDNVVVAGNQTVAAAAEAGISEVLVVEARPDQLVAVKRSDWTKTEATGYAIADNRAAELAEWDFEDLSKQLGALQADGLDLAEIGWEPHEVEPLLAADWNSPTPPPDDEDDDEAEAPADEPHPRTVTFSPEAWEVVRRAVERLRESEEDDAITEQRAIELICADWLAGN